MNTLCRVKNPSYALSFGLCLLVFSTSSGSAELLSSYSYDSFYSAPGQGTLFDTGSDSTSTTQPLTHTSIVAPAALTVFVQSDFGVQKAAIASARFGGGTEPFQGGGGQVNSRWIDTFQINGGIGSATAVYQMRIDGTLSLSGLSSLPSARVELRALSNAFSGFSYARLIGVGTDVETWQGTSYASGILIREFQFTYGVPFVIQSDLLLGGADGGIASFGSTILAGFIVPAGAVLSSESGAAYAELSPIPEPSAMLLSAAGLALLLIRICGEKAIRAERVDA